MKLERKGGAICVVSACVCGSGRDHVSGGDGRDSDGGDPRCDLSSFGKSREAGAAGEWLVLRCCAGSSAPMVLGLWVPSRFICLLALGVIVITRNRQSSDQLTFLVSLLWTIPILLQ